MPPAEWERLWSYWHPDLDRHPRLALGVPEGLLKDHVLSVARQQHVSVGMYDFFRVEPAVGSASLVREGQELGVMRRGVEPRLEVPFYAPIQGVLEEARAYARTLTSDTPYVTPFLLIPASEHCTDGCEAIEIGSLLPECSLFFEDAPEDERERDRTPAQGRFGPPREGLLVDFELPNDVGVIFSDGEAFWFNSGDVEGDLPRDMPGQSVTFCQAIGQKARAGRVGFSSHERPDAEGDQPKSTGARDELARLKTLVDNGELTVEDLSEAITRLASAEGEGRTNGTLP